MGNLLTPFGEIRILIDSEPVPYEAKEGRIPGHGCPHVLGRYQIAVHFISDGKAHTIACVFEPVCPYERSPESGERLECQGFYNDQRYKMSIGVECDTLSGDYDYDAGYLENGMAYLIDENTQTDQYTFGLAWIDNVGWNDPVDDENDRDVETWYGADPTLAL